ncbi:Aldo/keto oxidoreductase [hydrothermal vent metagenome]|uniref:Aldo/keto oxidoreductase n=1 Tax=hydrothermal vent metagenome TaxID=652676 RepID=A0A1W1C2D9_9ZZZZ
MPDFGFGTYRISDHNQAHIDALIEAIRGGIKLIDTSTNYFDGGAERAIAKAFRHFDAAVYESVEIVSKFGYIQGSLLQEYKDTNSALHKLECSVVEYAPDCYHSISKEFVHHQLTRSLERLQRESLGCYMIHNPEYYILDAIKKGVPKDEYLDGMYEQIFEAFCALEEEVSRGRIKSYGISSNSFAKPSSLPDFLPYEDLTTLAHKAAKEMGNQNNSFTTIELPINIAEKEGLKCSFWAKEQGLRVLANRPLNAMFNGKMYRLAEYEESRDYYMYLNELLEFCDNDLLRPVYNLIEQLDESKHRFGFIGEYDHFVHAQVLPHLQRSLKNIEGDTQEKLLTYLELFLTEYREMVASEGGRKVKEELKHLFKNCHKPLQKCALEYLLKQESIDYILVGARRIRYVYELLALKEELER